MLCKNEPKGIHSIMITQIHSFMLNTHLSHRLPALFYYYLNTTDFPITVDDKILHHVWFWIIVPDSKEHGANMGPTWVLSAPDEPHVGPMDLAIRGL